jgi:hypothetical protein
MKFINNVQKCQELFSTKLLQLLSETVRELGTLHDNARPHSVRAAQFLQSLKWEVLAYPSHSQGLVPSDYRLFSKLEKILAGNIFGTTR